MKRPLRFTLFGLAIALILGVVGSHQSFEMSAGGWYFESPRGEPVAFELERADGFTVAVESSATHLVTPAGEESLPKRQSVEIRVRGSRFVNPFTFDADRDYPGIVDFDGATALAAAELKARYGFELKRK